MGLGLFSFYRGVSLRVGGCTLCACVVCVYVVCNHMELARPSIHGLVPNLRVVWSVWPATR
jgi:predicted metal-binding protein